MAKITELLDRVGRRLGMLLRRENFDPEMDEELRLHRELKEQQLKDKGLPPEEAHYMAKRHLVTGRFNSFRLMAQLTTVYGILALILASIGLYGVAAYTVARRTSEIGIRMALGAQRRTVIGMVLRNAMQPIALGLLVGVPVALAGGHAIASQLFGVKAYDPIVLAGAVAVLASCAVLAAIIPARRAASIDPIRALRTE
jgi:ABC-type antimicrobial peptide transport system permease subunit